MRKEEELQRAIKVYHEVVIFADKLDGGALTNNHHGNGNGREHDAGSAVPQRGPSAVYPGPHLNRPIQQVRVDSTAASGSPLKV